MWWQYDDYYAGEYRRYVTHAIIELLYKKTADERIHGTQLTEVCRKNIKCQPDVGGLHFTIILFQQATGRKRISYKP